VLLVDELRDAWRSEPRDHRVALAVILAIGVALRLANLTQPMRYDESVTYVEFVRFPFAEALSRFHTPNQVFHTLLAKASVAVLGNEPWALRLPALLAGVFILPAAWAVAHAIYGSRAALIAAAIVAASGVLTLYSTSARGHSIVVFAFLALLLVGMRLVRTPTNAAWVTLCVVSAFGLWTSASMAFPFGAVFVWLALTFAVEGRYADLRRLGVAAGATIVLALLAYAPVLLEGVPAAVRQEHIVGQPWPQFLTEMADTVPQAIKSWGLGVPPLFSMLLLAFAIYALAKHATLSSTRIALPVAAYAWSAWLLVVTHRAPAARVWLWAFPIAAGLVGAGVVALLERWERTRPFAARVPALAVLLAAATAGSVALSGAVRLTRDMGTYRDAAPAVAAIKPFVRPGDRIVAAYPTNGPLAYYAMHLGVDTASLMFDQARASRLIIIVDKIEEQTLGPILQATPARDTSQYDGAILATLPNSTVFLFTRRDAKR
jgi:hypothetical protein